jgi:hypothetical protein
MWDSILFHGFLLIFLEGTLTASILLSFSPPLFWFADLIHHHPWKTKHIIVPEVPAEFCILSRITSIMGLARHTAS